MSELLPCPFCGSKEVVVEPRPWGLEAGICNSCGAEGPSHETSQIASIAWNRRIPPIVGEDAREQLSEVETLGLSDAIAMANVAVNVATGEEHKKALRMRNTLRNLYGRLAAQSRQEAGEDNT